MVNRQAIPFFVEALFFITSNEIKLCSFSGSSSIELEGGRYCHLVTISSVCSISIICFRISWITFFKNTKEETILCCTSIHQLISIIRPLITGAFLRTTGRGYDQSFTWIINKQEVLNSCNQNFLTNLTTSRCSCPSWQGRMNLLGGAVFFV